MRYWAIMRACEEGGFTVTFPDLPGCITEGDDEDEALANAEEALSGFISAMVDEGMDVPAPSGLSAINARKESTDDAVMLVRFVRDTTATKRVGLNLNVGLLEAVDEEVKRLKITRSSFMQKALQRALAAF